VDHQSCSSHSLNPNKISRSPLTPFLPPRPPRKQKTDNVDLGTACGKLFRVSCLAITDAGDSDILKTTEA
jgi:hypothetical protein